MLLSLSLHACAESIPAALDNNPEPGGDAIAERADIAEPNTAETSSVEVESAPDLEVKTPEEDTSLDVLPPLDIDEPGPEVSAPIDPSGSFEIAEDACCLTVSGDRALWSEGGNLWVHTLSTGKSEMVAQHPSYQTDPALSGDVVVWADDRGGDQDIWMLNLSGGEPTLLFGAPGDQDAPSIDGTRVVFVHRATAPYSDKEADIWMIDLVDASMAKALTSDLSEQSYPHIKGDRVVWTDFRNDPQGVYTDFVDPFENNGDIFGYDLDEDLGFLVTDDPSKQLRPISDGDDLVWLDWRGINPEPKYSEFQVYTRTISPDKVLGAERLVAWSSWETPELWQRPSVLGGVVAWIGVPEEESFASGVFSAKLSDATITPNLIAGSEGTLEAVSLSPQGILWLGAGTLGIEAFDIGSGQ